MMVFTQNSAFQSVSSYREDTKNCRTCRDAIQPLSPATRPAN